MAAYNAERYISEAIESVLNQSYDTWELLIINDGSTDKTLDTVKKYEFNPKIKIYHQQNRGQCAATNLGLKNATGDFIQFLDADDTLHKDKLFNQINLQQNYDPQTITYSNWLNLDEKVTTLEKNNFKIHQKVNPLDWVTEMLDSGEMLANSCYLIPAGLVQNAGLYNESLTLNNDLEYFVRTVLCSKQIIYCDSAFTYYRRNVEASLVTRSDLESVTSEFEAKMLAAHHLISKDKKRKSVIAVAKLLTSFLYSNAIFFKTFYPKINSYIKNDLKLSRFPLVGNGLFTYFQKFFGFYITLFLKSLWIKFLAKLKIINSK